MCRKKYIDASPKKSRIWARKDPFVSEHSEPSVSSDVFQPFSSTVAILFTHKFWKYYQLSFHSTQRLLEGAFERVFHSPCRLLADVRTHANSSSDLL